MPTPPYQNSKQQYPQKVTVKIREAFLTGDQPNEVLGEWLGYFHYQDPTVQKENSLTFPSQNCFIPMKDKIVPRLGSILLGQPFTTGQAWPIIGNKKRFATMSGIEVEVRVEKTNDSNLKDLISVLYPDPLSNIPTWYQITENVNPLVPAVGKLGMNPRYYMDDWFDTDLDPALSLNLTRLIGTNGTLQVLSWTGGIGQIGSLVVNTSITTVGGVTWASLGFVDPALGGTGNIIVNGVAYAITGGWATDTLTLSSTSGISVNDLAFAQIQSDNAPIPVDVCCQNDNYMFYGAWNSRKLFMSNGFGKDATQVITNAQAVQNDLVIGTTNYTGTGQHVYKVTIDSVNPNQNDQEFISGTDSAGNLNDGVYNTSGYTGTPGVTNVYNMVTLADLSLTASVLATFTVGETVTGATSLAQGTVVAVVVGTDNMYGIRMNTGFSFEAGENVKGSNSGLVSTVIQALWQNWDQFTKNGVIVNINAAGLGALPISPIATPPFTLIDGLTFQFGNYQGHGIGDSWQLTINQGGADTFQYQIDGATPVATLVPITGVAQSLGSGITISFVNTTGHTLGDTWDITVTQGVTKAWINFYYTLPTRIPGEGYIYQLASNFWTMKPQESQMYVNTTYGDWAYITTQLSSDLQNETVSLTPLKQTSASKVIFPYMIDYLDNDLLYVTTEKTLDIIGRQQLIQLPQIANLSQPVALDFKMCSFVDGSMEYWDKKAWITSPHDGMMLCYDNLPENKYWQPPQVIPENGILSIYNDTLISHSYLRNQTNTLFTGTTGDNESNYTVLARTPYTSKGNRWGMKSANMTFVEGHIKGAPPMKMNVLLGVNGCGGIKPHDIVPVVCIAPDRAPFGKGRFGSHPHGSDLTSPPSYFNEIYERYNPILQYYFLAFELECTTTNHSYDWLTIGLNSVVGNIGNNKLKNKSKISRT